MAVKEITLEAFIKAAEKNGYAWEAGGRWNESEGGFITGARTGYCVLEQAAMNLELGAEHWAKVCGALNDISETSKVGDEIFTYNDHHAKSYSEVITFIKEILDPYPKDTVLTISLREN